MCRHDNPASLRLIAYTRYGPLIGCLECGTSMLARDFGPAPVSSRRRATAGEARPIAAG